MAKNPGTAFCNFELIYKIIEYIHNNCVIVNNQSVVCLSYQNILNLFHTDTNIFRHHCDLLCNDGCFKYTFCDELGEVHFYNFSLRIEDRFQSVIDLLERFGDK